MITARIKEVELPLFESELIAVSVVFRDEESATVASAEVIVLLPREDMNLSTLTARAIAEAKRFLSNCQNAETLNLPLADGGANSADDSLS